MCGSGPRERHQLVLVSIGRSEGSVSQNVYLGFHFYFIESRKKSFKK